MSEAVRVIPFERVRMRDLAQVGGKNASLGEMIGELSSAGIRVPGGFATTADAFREFLQQDGLAARIEGATSSLDVTDVGALSRAGKAIRGWIANAPLPPGLARDIEESYHALVDGADSASFAVRSSATAEDLPDASFAGQQDTLLNISGLHNTLHAVSEVFASIYNDRAIAYRAHHGFAHRDVALSVGVQRMVRSDEGAAGVMFTLDTESGFEDVVLITSAYGLGESVVQGSVNPDEFYVYKPNLAAGRPAVLRKTPGSKATRMIFGASAAAGQSTRVVDVP
jgi:pyruvate, water dikinase